VTRLKEQGMAPEILVAVTFPVERESWEINRRTEIGARWTYEGAERVARLLDKLGLNGTRLESYT